jgi:hypothetical protein
MAQIVQPEARKTDPVNEPVPVARKAVGWERLALSTIDDEVEVGPRFTEN